MGTRMTSCWRKKKSSVRQLTRRAKESYSREKRRI